MQSLSHLNPVYNVLVVNECEVYRFTFLWSVKALITLH